MLEKEMNSPPFDVEKEIYDIINRFHHELLGDRELMLLIKDLAHRCADDGIEKAARYMDSKDGTESYEGAMIRSLKTRKGSEKENSK